MRLHKRTLLLPAAVLVLWPSVAASDERADYCPERIETEQSLRTAVEGFEAFNPPRPQSWARLDLYEGRPQDMVSLKYDSEADSGDGSYELTWNLDRKTEYWIQCWYDGTSVSLIKKLPPVGECKLSVSGAQELKLACR